jgi:methylisocitrate lyase
MSAILSIPELCEQEKYCVHTPCVYDCASARACELAGYKAILLSGGEAGEVMGAIGENEMTESELLFIAERITEFSPLPLVVDCGCFNDDPASVYRWSKKFAQTGSMALLIEDERDIDKATFLKMVKAALMACENTRCVVIARSNRPLRTSAEIDYVVDVLNEAMDLGAYMTMACGLNSTEKARIIGERVKGPKMYPDQTIHNGKPEVVDEEIYKWGFTMISYHYTLKVAMAAIVEYGKKNLKAGNNKPATEEVRLYNGHYGCSAMPMFDYQGKFDKQEAYTGVHWAARVPGESLD